MPFVKYRLHHALIQKALPLNENLNAVNTQLSGCSPSTMLQNDSDQNQSKVD